MSRTFRIRQRIKKLMMDTDDLPTNVIFDHVNKTMTWGVTMQQLGNILSKDKDIVSTGEVRKKGSITGTYTIQTWCLTDEYKERNHDVCEDVHSLCQDFLRLLWLHQYLQCPSTCYHVHIYHYIIQDPVYMFQNIL